MEKSNYLKKRIISTYDDEEEMDFNEYIESTIFIPKEIFRSISDKGIERIYNYLKSCQVLKDELSKLKSKNSIIIIGEESIPLIEKIKDFEIRTTKTVETVYNNLDRYGKLNHKLKMQILFEKTLMTDPNIRSYKSLCKNYNKESTQNNVSETTIYNTLSKKIIIWIEKMIPKAT